MNVELHSASEVKVSETAIDYEPAMDKQLWLIKDYLPKVVLENITKSLDELPGVKFCQDMSAFYVIEFHTSAAATAAQKEGFGYVLDGQHYKCNYSNVGTVSIYLSQQFKNKNFGF